MLPDGVRIPESVEHKVLEVSDDGCYIKLCADIRSVKQCNTWIAEYSKVNRTKWIVRDSAPNLKRLVCR